VFYLSYVVITITKASKVIRFIQALKHVVIQKNLKFKVENNHMTKWFTKMGIFISQKSLGAKNFQVQHSTMYLVK
jgi:lipoate-protein ligase B